MSGNPEPRVDATVFVAEGARILGDVVIGEGASIWFNAVLRGDEGNITIGPYTNIQDNAVIHSDMMIHVKIGENVTIGHGAVIRGCKIGNNVMIGMNATVMTNAEIGDFSIVGANTFIPYDRTFPPRSLITGSPAKLVRKLRDEDIAAIAMATDIYKDLAQQYVRGKIRGYKGSGR